MRRGEISSEVSELLMQSYRAMPGRERIDVLERAIEVADAIADVPGGFEAREQMLTEATSGGFPEKSLTAYAWLISRCDAEPDRFDERSILWQYKWVAFSLPEFPTITLERIDRTLRDMTRRYEKNGRGMRGPFKIGFSCAMRMGRRAEAEADYQRWMSASDGYGDDCEACEQDTQVEYHVYAGDDGRAIREAETILMGALRCESVPHSTHATVLMPMFRLGRDQEAVWSHARGWAMIRAKPRFVVEAAEHLTFLTMTRNTRRGLAVLERFLGPALETWNGIGRSRFLTAAYLLFTALEGSGRGTRKLRLPQAFPAHEAGGVYSDAVLREWFRAEALVAAGKLDARNGNDWYSRPIHEAGVTLGNAREVALREPGTGTG